MEEPYRIELAGALDVERIAELANRAAETGTANFATEPEPPRDWLADWQRHASHHPWLVARSAAGVLGFAKSSPHRPRGAYRWSVEMSVYIDETHHGRGIGTALYAVLIPILEAQGYVTLLAGITDGHLGSERLHARAGFVRCGTYHRVGWKQGRWLDVGYWERQLGDGRAPSPIRPVTEIGAERHGDAGLRSARAP
jgi:phosphinothricin acetyltransferase